MLGSGCLCNLFLAHVLYGKLKTSAPVPFCPVFSAYSCAKKDSAHLGGEQVTPFCSSPCLKAKFLIFAGLLTVLV